MMTNEQGIYIQPLLFGVIRLDENTPESIEGILFKNANEMDIGLLFVNGIKILFMHVNAHLSARCIVETLKGYYEWLGADYSLHIIASISTDRANLDNMDDKTKVFGRFIANLPRCFDEANFKFGFVQDHKQNNEGIVINRTGEISSINTKKQIETAPDAEVRNAINYLNCFTDSDSSSLNMTNILMFTIQNRIDTAYMHLDLQYDEKKWTDLPQLNEIAAPATRYFKITQDRFSPLNFFKALTESMPDYMQMRIDSLVLSRTPVMGIFKLNNLYDRFKIACTYYNGLLKKATGPLSQQLIEAYKAGEYVKSEMFALEALKIILVSGSLEALCVAYYNLGSSLMQQKKYKEAIDELTSAKNTYEKLGNQDRVTYCEKKIKICQDLENFAAFNKYHNMQPIHEAVRNNNFNEVKALFEKDPNALLETDLYGWTALTYAILFRVSIEIIKFILEKAPETAREVYWGQYTEEDVWELDLHVTDCDEKYSLLRFSLHVPKKFQAFVLVWDEKTQIEVATLLFERVPEICRPRMSEEEFKDDESYNDLKYALLKKAPSIIIQLILDKTPELFEKTESLITAILAKAEYKIIQILIEQDIEGSGGTSLEHHITPIFAAVYVRSSLNVVRLLLEKAPKAALQLTGSQFLSGWPGNDGGSEDSYNSDDYVSVPNTTILIFALEHKRFEIAEMIVDKIPALASIPDEKQRKPIDILLKQTQQLPRSGEQQKNRLIQKIKLHQFLMSLTPADEKKVVSLQALARGYISRKRSGVPQIRAERWPSIKQQADDLISQLSSTSQYKAISELAQLLDNKKFHPVSEYMKRVKWLNDLSSELLMMVFNFLNGLDLIKLSQVSKRFYFILKDGLLWKKKIEADLRSHPVELTIKNYPEQYRNMQFGDSNIVNKVNYSYESFLQRIKEGKKPRFSKNDLYFFFCRAIKLGADMWVLKLLQSGLKPTLKYFAMGLQYGDLSSAKLFLKYGLDINSIDETGIILNSDKSSLFHVALYALNVEMLHFLFSKPLITVLPLMHQMAALGKLEELKHMLDVEEADINQKDINNFTPIFWAAVMGQTAVVSELIRRNANLRYDNNLAISIRNVSHTLLLEGESILLVLCVLCRQLETAKELADIFHNRGELPDLQIRFLEGPRISLLQLVSEIGDLDGIKFLLSLRNKLPNFNPLVFAARNGHASCLKYLIEKGFPVNECIKLDYKDGDGALVRTSETPLGAAAEGGHLECVELLLNAVANPNQFYKQYCYQKPREESSTLSFNGLPLHKLAKYIASYLGSLEKNELSSLSFDLLNPNPAPQLAKVIQALKLLLNATENINTVDTSNNKTVLTYLISSFRRKARNVIIEENYNLLIIHCMQMCLDKGADINHSYGHCKRSVLHEVAEQGRVKLLEFLLLKGADVKQQDEQGKTPLMLAKDQLCIQKLKDAMLLKEANNSRNDVLLFSSTSGQQQTAGRAVVASQQSKTGHRKKDK